MKVKICGMKHKDNILELAALKPDMMGFIFYERSLRCVDGFAIQDVLGKLDKAISKVGVFVKASIGEVVETCRILGLDLAQLHGGEGVAYCQEVKKRGVGLIKVFHVDKNFKLEAIAPFTSCADYFLFDTKTKAYGGSGKQFDWSLLKHYKFEIPFFLSGGIGENDINAIKQLGIPQLAGIDANSQLETEPGLKDILKAERLIELIREP